MNDSALPSNGAASPDDPALYFRVLDGLPLGIAVYHLDDPEDPGSLRLVQANEAASRAIGFDVKAEIGRTFNEALPQSLETDIPAQYAEVALTGKGKNLGDIEYGDDRVERGVFRVEAFALPGRHVGIVFEEVTQRRSVEDRLRLLTSAVENARDSIIITGPELDEPGPKIVYANPAFSRLTGYELSEVLGKTPRFLQGPETDRAVIDRLRARLEAGETFSGETFNYRKDGTPFVMDWDIAPIRDAAGEVTHWVATQRDVTERKQAKERLQQSEEELRSLAESTFEGIALSENGRIILVNETFCEMMGYTQDELIGMNPAEEGFFTVASESRDDVEARLAQGFQGAYETVLRRKDDSTFPAEIRVRLIRSGDREVRASAVRDVSERVATLEATRRQALRFRAIFDSALQYIFLIRPDGTLAEANRTALEFAGIVPEEVLGEPIWESRWWGLADETREQLRAAVGRAADGELVRYVVDVRSEGDRIATLDFSVKPVADEEGQIDLLIAEGRDITEDVRTEQELRRLKATQRRLATEEARYRSLIDATSAIVWITSPSGEFETEQRSWSAFTSQTAEELMGWGWLDAVHPDDRPRVVEAWKDAREGKGLLEVEHRLCRYDEEYRTMSVRAVPLFDDDGTLREWVGAHTDVHDVREAEAALRESEAELLALVDNLPELAWSARPDGHIDFYNHRWYEYTGTTLEEMQGWGWEKIHDPEMLSAVTERWTHSIESGEPFEMEFPLRGADGTFRWFLTRIRPLRNEEGEVTRWIGMNTDVDDHRRLLAERDAALARAEKSEARYRFLGETLRQQIWTAHPDGQLDYVNRFVLDYFGRTVDEMIGEGWQGVVHEDDLPLVVERWTHSLGTGESYEVEFRLRRASDETFRWHLGRATALRDEDGRLVKWFGANTDVHERVVAEAAVAEANQTLEARVVDRTRALAAFTEDLKALHRITTARHAESEDVFQDYLRAGCEIFEMPIGILSQTPLDAETGERTYRLHTVESSVPGVAAGLEIPLRDAFCDAVVEREETVSYADAAEAEELSCHTAYSERGLRSYIGTPIYIDDELFGTLNFVSPDPRPEGFAPHEHELVEVIAELVGRLLSQQRAERERADADARYRSIVRTIDEGLLLVDADGQVLMSNPAAKYILGLGEGEVYGRVAGTPSFQVIRPDGTSVPEDDLPEREVLRTGRTVKGVIQGIVRPDGETRWYSVNARAATRRRGGVSTVVVSFTDVTEQRQAEIELRESEAQLQNAQQIARVGSWKWDIAADEIQWSDELYRIFGLTLDAFEPTYERYLEHIHPEDRDLVRETVERAMEQREPYEVNHRVIQPDGTLRHVRSLGEVMVDEAGTPTALQGTAQDVTENYEAERALARLSRELEQILEAAGEGIYGLAPDGTTTFVNQAAADMIGWEPDALLGRPQHDVLHHHHADGSPYPVEECPIRQTLQDGIERRITGEVFWRKDGTSFPVEYVTAPMRADGDMVGAVVVFQDVTKRVRAEQDMQRYADDLEERNAELEQFAYVASHDLQEPLRMVSSFLQLLQRRYADQLDETADEYIAYAVDGAKRMQVLIQDLLAYSRVGTRGKPFEPVDMNRTLGVVLTDLSPALTEVEAEVEAEPLPTVSADETQVRQLLQNLIANAIKFRREERPVVRIRAERTREGDGAAWRFSVSDNGIGIEPRHAERIFQIFQRLHTRDEYEGTGIGLAMCKKIVERHGGRIWFESEPGHGTTFYFTIPARLKEE